MKKYYTIIITVLALGFIFMLRCYLEKAYPNSYEPWFTGKPKPKTSSTIVIENGNSIQLKNRDELDVYLINRYIEHLKNENDSVELKVVNDVLNSRYNMP